MKRLITIVAVMLALCANAQDYSKMSRFVKQVSFQHSDSQYAGAKGTFPTLQSGSGKYLLALVKGDEEAVKDYCISHHGDLHIANIPVGMLATLSEDPRIIRIEAQENTLSTDLDSVATCVDIRPLWNGDEPLPQAYDGTDVVVGVVDVGIDYMHPTFRSTKDGHLRIVRAWDMLDFSHDDKYDAKRQFPLGCLLTDTTAIMEKGQTTDSKTEYHGTHTAGIAAGSGWDTKYRGMAPEADIYAVGGLLTDNENYLTEELKTQVNSNNMYLAFERIFEYADTVDKPAVINFSISGQQDMTNEDKLLNEYLEKITEKPGHIIVASIGNNGNKRRYMPKSADTESVGGMMYASNKIFLLNISTQSTLTLRITDYSRTEAQGRVKDFTLDFKPGNKKPTSKSGLKWNNMTQYTNIKSLDSLSVYIYSGDNGFDANYVGYDIFIFNDKHDLTTNAKQYAIEILGDDAAAEVFCQGGELKSGTSYSPTLLGAEIAGNCGSPATLPSVIGVGMTTYWELGNGKRWDRSSIGPSLHGLTKPDIMASGYKVTSSYNNVYYANKGGSTVKGFSSYNGKDYPWCMQWGTSMSTPAVAGIIALWLQAKPTLTKDEIMDVFAHTSRQPDENLTYPNNEYGYGEIDAYKGLLYILGIDGIEELDAEPLTQGTVLPANGGIKVSVNGQNTTALPCRVYDITGKLVSTAAITDGDITIPLPKGVYAVQVGKLGSTLVRVE